ncbi:MAG: hypothetical protein ACRC67_39655 [Inquilinus sp.]|uniref:hypothetical protein n=1 Tax=Inquilinus sp. TaxID=1932117 RepID=UPI003F2E0C37
MPYEPNELVNLIYSPDPSKQVNRTDMRLADAISIVLNQPNALEQYFIIVRDGDSIGTEGELIEAAKELGILR